MNTLIEIAIKCILMAFVLACILIPSERYNEPHEPIVGLPDDLIVEMVIFDPSNEYFAIVNGRKYTVKTDSPVTVRFYHERKHNDIQ